MLTPHKDLDVCYTVREEVCSLFELSDEHQARDGQYNWFKAAKDSGIDAL